MIRLVEHADGCVLAVRAQPGARRTGVVGEQAGALKIAVMAPAQDGRANEAVREVLAAVLGVKRGQVELSAGPASRDKRFLVRGLSSAEVRKRLEEGVGG